MWENDSGCPPGVDGARRWCMRRQCRGGGAAVLLLLLLWLLWRRRRLL